MAQTAPPKLQHLCYETVLSDQDQTVCQGEIIRVAFSDKECCVDKPRAEGFVVPSNGTDTCHPCTGVTGTNNQCYENIIKLF